MKFTIQTHDSYPEDNRLELPAIDFSRSTSDRTKGMQEARLIHSASSAEKWSYHGSRDTLLTDMIATLTKRLLNENDAELDYTLHVYLVD